MSIWESARSNKAFMAGIKQDSNIVFGADDKSLHRQLVDWAGPTFRVAALGRYAKPNDPGYLNLHANPDAAVVI